MVFKGFELFRDKQTSQIILNVAQIRPNFWFFKPAAVQNCKNYPKRSHLINLEPEVALGWDFFGKFQDGD